MVAALAGALVPAAAQAEITALAAPSGGAFDFPNDAAPALYAERAVWGAQTGDTLVVRDASGEIARYTGPDGRRIAFYDLAASSQRIALLVGHEARTGPDDLRRVLLSAAPGQALAPLPGPEPKVVRHLDVIGDEVVTTEHPETDFEDFDKVRTEVITRRVDGAGYATPLPTDAHNFARAVAGPYVALTTKAGDVVVVERNGGREVRRLPASSAPIGIANVGVGEDGAVIAAGAARIGWAPPGATTFTLRAFEADLNAPLVVRGGLVALPQTFESRASRMAVIEPGATAGADEGFGPPPRVRFKGPLGDHIRDVRFDGSRLAWNTDTCRFTATLTSPWRSTIPDGPCVRSEVTWTVFGDDQAIIGRKRPRYRVRVHCLSAPVACTVQLRRNRVPDSRRSTATIRRGRSKMVYLRLDRHDVTGEHRRGPFAFMRVLDGKKATPWELLP